MKNHCFLQHVGSETRVGYRKILFTSYKALVTLFLFFFTLGAWSQAVFQIKSPASIKGFYTMQNADSTTHFWGNGSTAKKSVEAELVLATGADSVVSAALGVKYQGKIAVVFRGGGVSFGDKALRAQEAGAVAIVIVNHGTQADGTVNGDEVFAMSAGGNSYTDGSGSKVKIPVIMISKNSYLTLSPALRSGETVLGYIGGRQLAKNDIKLDYKRVVTPARLTNVSLLAQANDIIDSLGVVVYNNGSDIQDSILCEVVIKYGSEILHQDIKGVKYTDESGNTVTTIPPGKYAGYITFKPFVNTNDLKSGKYTLTYSAFTTIKGKEDDFKADNTVEIPFFINDTIYSPTVIESYDRIINDTLRDSSGKPVTPLVLIKDTLRYKNQPNFSTFFQPGAASNFKSFGPCLVFRDPNASRIRATGLTLTAMNYSSANQKYIPLKDEPFKINVYEWADNFSGFKDTLKYNNLIPLIQNQEYVATTTNSWDYLSARFDDKVLFENDKRYLICVETSNTNIRFGYDTTSADLTARTKFYDQPLNMLKVDGNFYGTGFGLNRIPAMALTVQERKFESSEKELLSFGLKAPDSTKIEINYDNITVQVPKGTDLTKLVAEFTNSDKSKVTVNGILQTSGVTVNNFSNKTVEYVVTAEDGSTKTYFVTINYCTSQYNKIYLSQEAYCPNQEINFSLSSQNYNLIKDKYWNFGNGKYFTQKDAYGTVHTSYSKNGVYTVSVSYINSACFNALDTTSVKLTISDKVQPNSDFYLGKSTLCPNEPFSLNASSNNEVSYVWDMGDKSIYTGSSVNHAYKEEWDNSVKLTVTNACGNSTTTSKMIKVSKAGYIDNANAYIYSSNVACIGEPVSFNANGIYQSILWNFKDNTTNETVKSPEHRFKDAGDYLVQARLKDYCGVEKIVSKNITIKSSMPFTNIQAITDQNVCPGEKVRLNYYQYSSGIKNYSWLLPNNEIILEQSFEKTFNEGVNTIYLKLTNYCGNDTMLTTKINVTRNIPISTYNSFVDNQEAEFCPNEEFSIRYNSSGIKSYVWTGQGLVNQEDGYAGYFKLTNYGEYTMQLKLTSFCGKDTTLMTKVKIVKNKPFNEQFSDYTFNRSYCPGEEIYFSKNNYSSNYKLEEYDYGDGKKGTSSSHTYASFGDYNVKLKLTNYCNTDTTIQTNVKIAPVSISKDAYIYVSGNYNNNSEEVAYCKGDEIRLDVNSNQGGSYKSIVWDFGDGTEIVDNSEPSHVFAKSGILTIKAKLTSYCGDTLTIFKKMNIRTDVGHKGYIDENIPNAVCPGENANFSIYQNFKAVAWDFGDGTSSTKKSTMHSYTKTGMYTVTMKLTNNCNVDTLIKSTVEVRNDVTPDIDFSLAADEICPGEKIVFFQSADSRDYQISYDFGDNSKDYIIEDSIAKYNLLVLISHKFLTKGTYQVKVTAKNKCGLTDTETETITVQDGMKLNPSSDIESEKITEDTAIFLLESHGAEFTWNFGKNDIVKTDVGYIKHGFSSVGNKNISVFVKTACGDTATFYTQMTINKLSTGDDVTSGIKDVQEARFTIYPNPNQGVFNIAGLPIGSYKIMNLMGAEVYRFRVENTDIQTLNLEHLAKGVYQVASEDIKIIHNKVVITD